MSTIIYKLPITSLKFNETHCLMRCHLKCHLFTLLRFFSLISTASSNTFISSLFSFLLLFKAVALAIKYEALEGFASASNKNVSDSSSNCSLTFFKLWTFVFSWFISLVMISSCFHSFSFFSAFSIFAWSYFNRDALTATINFAVVVIHSGLRSFDIVWSRKIVWSFNDSVNRFSSRITFLKLQLLNISFAVANNTKEFKHGSKKCTLCDNYRTLKMKHIQTLECFVKT